MGSSGSKAARTAAGGSAARKYPSRSSGAPPSTSTTTSPPTATNAPPRAPRPAEIQRPGPTVRPAPRASGQRDEAINLDASDPDFARSLRQLGAVQPGPTLSSSSTFSQHTHTMNASGSAYGAGPDPRKNPAIMLLESRSRIAAEAEREFVEAGRRGFAGRSFVDVGVVRQILMMRERGMGAQGIERQLGLRAGTVGKLGAEGVVGAAQDV